jgi:hypothetical protein
MKKLILTLLFSPYQKALIYEALDEKEPKKILSLNETLNEDGIEIRKIKKLFISEFDLYK